MDISKIPIGQNPPHDVNAIIEIPQGSLPVKYELDKDSGALFVDRFLHTSMIYPANYGFIPHTLSGDGDPCDVLVVTQVPVAPTAVIRCRPIRRPTAYAPISQHFGTNAARASRTLLSWWIGVNQRIWAKKQGRKPR